MVQQLGIGIVGAGRIARAHLRSLAGLTDVRAVAVFDLVRDRAVDTAASFDIPFVAPSLEDLLERRDVDAVIVCTPPAAHAEPTIAALSAGKHVLCEKPFALHPAEAERMVLAAEENRRFLAVASARYRIGIGPRTAHHLISTGELGHVYHVRVTNLRVRGRPGIDIFQDAPWFLDRERAGGGALIDLGVYQLDVALWLLGNPRVASVLCTTYQGIGTPPSPPLVQTVEDHAVVMLTCENGASAIVETAWASNVSEMNTTVILGTKAGLRFNPLTKITAGPDRSAVEERLLTVPDDDASGVGDVTVEFVRAVGEGRQPVTPGRDALEVTRVISAAYQSAESGQPVMLT